MLECVLPNLLNCDGCVHRRTGNQLDDSRPALFYYYRPTIEVSGTATRVTFPEYLPGCNVGPRDPRTGTIKCDFASDSLVKVTLTMTSIPS